MPFLRHIKMPAQFIKNSMQHLRYSSNKGRKKFYRFGVCLQFMHPWGDDGELGADFNPVTSKVTPYLLYAVLSKSSYCMLLDAAGLEFKLRWGQVKKHKRYQ